MEHFLIEQIVVCIPWWDRRERKVKSTSEEIDFPPKLMYRDDGHAPIRLDVELFEFSHTSVAADVRCLGRTIWA
jgi:hypothetical protein